MNNKLIKLEAIRGFAAFYVVLHHTVHHFKIFNVNLSFLFRFGQEAVILFFVLSGFVIEYSYTNGKDKSFKTYFFKRFLRIYIPLLFVFLANFLILYISNNVKFDWMVLLGNIFMLQDSIFLKPNVITSTFLDNAPLWSLSYEWWFYMLYFPLIVFFKNKSSSIVYIVGILSALSYIMFPNFFNRELMYFTIWWSGVEIARLYMQEETINVKNLKNIILVLFGINVILGFNVYISKTISTVGVHPILELRHFGFALMAIFSALIWKKLKWVGFSSTLGIFSYLAPISYGIYISHYFLISNATYLNNIILNDSLRFVIYILICLGFSYLIERILYVKINRIFIKKTANSR